MRKKATRRSFYYTFDWKSARAIFLLFAMLWIPWVMATGRELWEGPAWEIALVLISLPVAAAILAGLYDFD